MASRRLDLKSTFESFKKNCKNIGMFDAKLLNINNIDE